MRVKKYIILFSILILLDRITKIIAINYISNFYTIPVIKNIFHLTYVENTGIAFGFFQGKNIFFLIINFIIIALFTKIFLSAKNKILRYSLLLIITGGIGNLADRIFYKKVIDFIDLRIWPVFNLSDSYVTIGGIIFFLKLFINGKDKKNKSF